MDPFETDNGICRNGERDEQTLHPDNANGRVYYKTENDKSAVQLMYKYKVRVFLSMGSQKGYEYSKSANKGTEYEEDKEICLNMYTMAVNYYPDLQLEEFYFYNNQNFLYTTTKIKSQNNLFLNISEDDPSNEIVNMTSICIDVVPIVMEVPQLDIERTKRPTVLVGGFQLTGMCEELDGMFVPCIHEFQHGKSHHYCLETQYIYFEKDLEEYKASRIKSEAPNHRFARKWIAADSTLNKKVESPTDQAEPNSLISEVERMDGFKSNLGTDSKSGMNIEQQLIGRRVFFRRRFWKKGQTHEPVLHIARCGLSASKMGLIIEGQPLITVSHCYEKHFNLQLQYPHLFMVFVTGLDAKMLAVPIEFLLTVLPQTIENQVPAEQKHIEMKPASKNGKATEVADKLDDLFSGKSGFAENSKMTADKTHNTVWGHYKYPINTNPTTPPAQLSEKRGSLKGDVTKTDHRAESYEHTLEKIQQNGIDNKPDPKASCERRINTLTQINQETPPFHHLDDCFKQDFNATFNPPSEQQCSLWGPVSGADQRVHSSHPQATETQRLRGITKPSTEKPPNSHYRNRQKTTSSSQSEPEMTPKPVSLWGTPINYESTETQHKRSIENMNLKPRQIAESTPIFEVSKRLKTSSIGQSETGHKGEECKKVDSANRPSTAPNPNLHCTDLSKTSVFEKAVTTRISLPALTISAPIKPLAVSKKQFSLHFHAAVKIQKWGVCYIKGEEPKKPNDFAQTMALYMADCGIHALYPQILYMMNKNIQNVFEQAPEETQLIVFVLKRNRKYGNWIKFCEEKYGIKTQVVTVETADRCFRTAKDNFLMKDLIVGYSATTVKHHQAFGGGYIHFGSAKNTVAIEKKVGDVIFAQAKSRGNRQPSEIWLYVSGMENPIEYSRVCQKGIVEVCKEHTPDVVVFLVSEPFIEEARNVRSDSEQYSVFFVKTDVTVENRPEKEVTRFHIVTNNFGVKSFEKFKTLTKALCTQQQIINKSLNVPSPIYVAQKSAKNGAAIQILRKQPAAQENKLN